MSSSLYRRLAPYGVAIASVGMAVGLTLWLELFMTRTLGAFFYIAVFVSSWYGGFRPGLMAVSFSVLAINYFFIPPLEHLQVADPTDRVRLGIFALVAVIINLLNDNLRTSKWEVEQLSQRLLQENAERLKTALAAARMGLWNWDMVTGAITWSPEHEQLFGLAVGTFDGRYETFDACLHPDDREGLNQAITQALENHSAYQHEYRVVWADGSIHWLEGRGQAFYNEAGQPIRMTGTIMDIDTHQQAEAALKQAKAELETRVAQRTAELTQANAQLQAQLLHRQQIESALKQSAQEIQDLYDNAPCGYHSLDHEGRFIRINNTELQWLGYDRDEIIGKKFTDLLLPESLPIFQANFPQFKQQGWIENLEFHLICQDGSSLPVCLSATALKDISGNFIMSRSIIFNISERKRTEVALKTSQVRFAGIVEIAKDAIISVDANQRITLFNQGAEAIFGYTSEEILGQPLDLLLPERFVTPHRRYMSGFAHSDGKARRMGERSEIFGLRKDGSEFPAEASISRLNLGNETLFTAILRDISDYKQAEATLSQLAAIVESSEDAIISKSLDGTITSWNASAQKLYGYTPGEAIGRSISLLLPADKLDEEAQFLERLQQGEHIQHYETVRKRKDGTVVDISLTVSPIKDATGKIIGASKIARDITQQRAIAKMKSEFISIVSHELRTPLTAIRGSLGLVAHGIYDKKPEKKQRMIEIAASQSDRLVRLVNDILDLQRLESGKMKLVMQACDAANLIQQSADTMRSYAEQNQIQLVVHLLPVQVWASPDSIIQTLTNLLSNAIKFSAPGGKVWLSAQLVNPEEQGTQATEEYTNDTIPNPQTLPSIPYTLFSVKDQGRGIPSDKLEIIFERFQQVDASDSREKGGTGLGLAICRKIIEQHEGKIWAESVVNEGSTFYFTLPIPANKEFIEDNAKTHSGD
ncbi:PAS domain S-box protein [Microcoleus sp. FACHB-53]|nr:PAS domain S-box protein [Microcoleus sp. FACHB-53]MBD2128150.1 PAS domain S-box protein [Microcoleus sp. FACHB-1]